MKKKFEDLVDDLTDKGEERYEKAKDSGAIEKTEELAEELKKNAHNLLKKAQDKLKKDD